MFGQFVLEIMTRKFVLTGAAVTILVSLTNVILAGANDYVFEPVKTEIKSSNVATIAVRLLHKPSARPVTDAVIVQMRIVMAHDGGAEMDTAFVPLASPKPGVYAFRAPLTMAGSRFLSIAAKVPKPRSARDKSAKLLVALIRIAKHRQRSPAVMRSQRFWVGCTDVRSGS
jgi:YtkA-like protein